MKLLTTDSIKNIVKSQTKHCGVDWPMDAQFVDFDSEYGFTD